MTMPVPDVPSTCAWNTPARNNPPIARPGQPLANVSAEPPRAAELTMDSGNPVREEGDEGAFLLPVWDPGFWILAPGGLTRRLLPSGGFINPDQTLAPDRAGCDPPT